MVKSILFVSVILAALIGQASAFPGGLLGSFLETAEVKAAEKAIVNYGEKVQANIREAKKDACESGDAERCKDMSEREKACDEVLKIAKNVLTPGENSPKRPLSTGWFADQLLGNEQPKLQNF